MNKNTISKWFSMFVLMMVAGITGATAQSLTVADFAIEQGETKEIAISVAAADGQTIYGIQTDITLSEGLTLTNAAAVDNSLTLTKNTLQSGPTRVSLLSQTGGTITAGDAIKLTVTAASDFAGGTIALTNSKLTTNAAGAEINVDNASAAITKKEAQPEEPVTGVFFSADVTATAKTSFAPGTTEMTSPNASIVGGKLFVISEQEANKELIGKQSSYFMFCMTNNNTYFKIELDHALAVGDVVSAMTYSRTDTELGLWLSTASSRPNECATALTIGVKETQAYEALSDYIVTEGDGLAGAKTLYIYRATGKSTYFSEFKITRPSQNPVPVTATFNFADPTFREKIGTAATDADGYIYNETFTTDGASLQVTSGSAITKLYVDNNRGQNLVTFKDYATLTFKAPEGKAITKIEFTAAGNSNINQLAASSGAIEGMVWTGNAEGVRFTQGGTSYLANAILTLVDKTGETSVLPAIEYTQCDNIAAFNALEAGTYTKVTLTDAEVIGKSADGYSTVWIQDATGGCWIQYTSLNSRLNEKTKINGTIYAVKRDAAGNTHIKEAEATLNSELNATAIDAYSAITGTIAEVNVAANLNKVVKIAADSLEMTSASAGKLYLGETTINVSNGTDAANQALFKIADWEKNKKLENITIVAILSASSATANQLLPISIEETVEEPVNTEIVNADFSSMEGWTENVSGSFRDFGNGLIGTYRVRTDDFIPAATVDETHLATEYCIGLEARWEGNFASYNQDVMLPAGNYKLTFDVENVNAGTTSANYNNLFKVTNGETVYVDESTEWMNGKSGWTSHAIRFILTEDATVNISLGYGTGSNNFGHANTPALYVSHLALGTFDPLVDFKEIALKEVNALPTGDALFLYPVDAVNTAKAAIETAATVDDINAAVATAKAAQNKPAADKAYTFELRLGGETPLYMALAEGGITIAEEATALKFIAVEGAEGQYNLTNENGTLFVGLAGGNAWTMSTLADQKAAWTFTPLPDGAYRINNLVTAGRFVGTNAADKAAGSVCYADKQTSNGNVDWLIAEYVAPVVEPIYIETDLTAQFNSLATTQWTGSSGQVGWAAPKVKTNSGLEVAAWEKYDGSCDWTGDIMSSSVTGLTPGTYKIELYGAAAFTFGRGFGSTAFTGDFTKDSSEAYSENDAITENTGVTLFAETAEGKVSKEIPIWYATNFNTSGIATATLENVIVGDAGTIKIGLSKTSTSTNWHVVQLKGVTAQVGAVELHATTLAAAQAALNAEENAIVTGDERDSLTAAITANTTVAEQTADAYKAAIAALNNAISAFTGAKAAYQSLIDAKAYLVDLPYADAAKKPVVEAATSATDATAKAEALMVALRAYYESNAMAEGVEGAQILTDSIKNPNAQDGINFWTIVKGEGSGGNIDIKNNEPWTDAAGVAEHNYFDGGNWGAQAWDVALEQKIALPAGKFLLTTIARAEKAVDFTLYAGTDSVKIPAISSVGGLFNRGWNNASVEFEMAEADSIVIGVRGVTAEIHNWMSFADFRLVQLEKPVVVEPIEGISYSWESPAGEPIQWGGTIAYVNGNGERLNYKNGDYYTICLNGKKANINDSIASDIAGKMVITLDKAVAEGDTIAYTAYITKNESKKASAYILFENGTDAEGEVFGDEANIDATFNGVPTLKYTVVPAGAAGSKTITLTRSQTGTNLFITKLQIIEKKSEPVPTGISTVKNCDLNGTIFNMNGQKVNKAQKGLFIINGKKVVVK